MEDMNYIVKRDEILVGQYFLKDNVETYPEGYTTNPFDFTKNMDYKTRNDFLEVRPDLEKFNFSDILWTLPHPSRTIIFALNQKRFAEDLLYDIPPAPVLNISDIDDFISNPELLIEKEKLEMSNVKTEALISEVFCIGPLLRYFGYPEFLNKDNILEIKERFFGDFVLDNCELFGLKETASNLTQMETYDSFGHHRTFNERIETVKIHRYIMFGIFYARSYYNKDGLYLDKFALGAEKAKLKSLEKNIRKIIAKN